MEIDHRKKQVLDKIRMVGELEHIRYHALRSLCSQNIDADDRLSFAIIAEKAKEIRRTFMSVNFPDVEDEWWCLGKAAASMLQIAYEIYDGDDKIIVEFNDLCNDIWGQIVKDDLSGCRDCKEDKQIDTENDDLIQNK